LTKLRTLILIILVAIPALFFGLGRRALWNPVEPRYAGICAELQSQDTWLVPTYNRRHFDQKPALFFWLGAATLSLAESDTARLFMVRFPSALGGLLLVLATWVLASELLDRRRGLIAAFLALTCWISFWSSRFCHMDTLFGASLTWAIFFALKGARCKSKVAAFQMTVGLSFCLFLGLMLKGPAVIAFLLATLVAHACLERSWSVFVKSRVLWGIPISIVLAAFWVIPAWQTAGNEWANALLYEAGILHLFDPTNSPKHGVFYYPSVIMVLLAPWSFFLPALFTSFWRRRKTAFQGESNGLRFALAWTIGILFVLYSGTTYRSRYLIPLVPPFAIFMADFFVHEFQSGKKRAMPTALGTFTVTLLLTVMGLSFLVPEQYARWMPSESWSGFFTAVAELPFTPRICGLFVIVLAIRAFMAVRAERSGLAFGSMILAIVVTFATWSAYGAPTMDRLRGDDELITAIRSRLDEGRSLVAVEGYANRESTEGYYYFELGRNLQSVEEDAESLRKLRIGKPCLLMLRERDLKRIGRSNLDQWQDVCEAPLGRHDVRLFVNQGTQPKSAR
jgi:4-amino-4-deoxy-L-arabinose transferase-like glycosyltransferase